MLIEPRFEAMSRSYEVEAEVVAELVVKHWREGANTIVLYGTGREAMVERLVVAKLGAIDTLTSAIFIDRFDVDVPPHIERDPAGAAAPAPVQTVAASSISDARFDIGKQERVVGAIVAVQFQLVMQSPMLHRAPGDMPFMRGIDVVDRSWNHVLLANLERASLAGLFWDAGAAPYIGYNLGNTEKKEDVRKAIKMQACSDFGIEIGRSCIARMKEANDLYVQFNGHPLLEHGYDSLEKDFVVLACARMGPDLVDRVAGPPPIGDYLKSVAHLRAATVLPEYAETKTTFFNSTKAKSPRWAIHGEP